jgi:hypothetical protein
MKLLLSMMLMLASASAIPQEVEIVPSVLDGSPNISPAGKLQCKQAADDLEIELSKLNGLMYRMESHPEMGYDVRHQDRMQISVLMVQRTEPMLTAIKKAAYDGKGEYCLDKMREGVKLARQIYNANIAYRKISGQ